MKISELKNNDVVEQCVDVEKSTYAPPVRKTAYSVTVNPDGAVTGRNLQDGIESTLDFTAGRWYNKGNLI